MALSMVIMTPSYSFRAMKGVRCGQDATQRGPGPCWMPTPSVGTSLLPDWGLIQ